MKRIHKLMLTFLLLTSIQGPSAVAEKKMYQWKNSNGSIQYGDRVPANEINKSYIIYNNRGEKIKVISRAKTKAEIQKEDNLLRQKLAIIKAKKQKYKEDQRLLRLFPDEDAVTRARDDRINSIDNGVSLSTDVLKLYKGNISSLRQTAAEHARARKPVPSRVKRKIAKFRVMIIDIETSIKVRRKKQQSIRKSYKKILMRYREIN